MTLKHRFLLHNLLLVGGMLIAGSVSVWRLRVLSGEVDVQRSVYDELRMVGGVAIEAGTAQGLLSDPVSNHDQIVLHLNNAIGGLDQFLRVSKRFGEADAATMNAYGPIDESAAEARARLRGVLDALRAASFIRNHAGFTGTGQGSLQELFTLAGPSPGAKAMRESVATALALIDQMGGSCIFFIRTHQQTASRDLETNLVIIGVMSLAAVLAAILLSISQYRLVMAPLHRLRQGVRRLADAQFTQQLDPAVMGKSPEFLDLAAEFNRMAVELDHFYHRLEQEVRTKSRELVRSERLASVGFLAAGVAHEINNPLNIISGYAELTMKRLESTGETFDEEAAGQTRNNLRIIREEAFRCKDITEKLLSLSRNGSDSWEELDLATVARDVAAMTRGLKNYRDRRLTVKLDPDEPLQVRANLTEMKQVLLNLTINALEAVVPGEGEVCIEGRRNNEWIEVSVKDNGRGMCPDVLSRVFEPFFTARRTNADRGTGLGLSITHAIVEGHHGRIEAESDGPGLGSRFTVCIPAAVGRG